MLGSSKLVAFLPTKEFARAKEFYGAVLNLPLVSEDGFALVFNANGTLLRVPLVSEFSPAPYTVLGWEVTDIRKMVKDLKKRGIAFESYDYIRQDEEGIWTTPGGDRVAWFKDPDGNLLSISQPGKRSQS
jgi:catechol 2,3-dioxygenase-like lactoylglutathione lyase family enzyme